MMLYKLLFWQVFGCWQARSACDIQIFTVLQISNEGHVTGSEKDSEQFPSVLFLSKCLYNEYVIFVWS